MRSLHPPSSLAQRPSHTVVVQPHPRRQDHPRRAGLLSAVRDFRAGANDFFADTRPGPKHAPTKDAARQRILALRAEGYSIDEIAATLRTERTPLNRTGISEVITEAGLPRIWRRPDAQRGGPHRSDLRRARILDLTDLPATAPTQMAAFDQAGDSVRHAP